MNDCETLNGGCDHNCTNLEGSYVCSCRDGFILGGDNRTCNDVNECSANPCSHICTNLPGRFLCECLEGYILDGDRLSCIGTEVFCVFTATVATKL